MSVSYLQLAGLGFVPGRAENMERAAVASDNLVLKKIAKGIKCGRNEVYIGTALTIIGAVGEACGVGYSVINVSIISLGGAALILGGTQLHQYLSLMRLSLLRSWIPSPQ